jgi:hypothetical protein
MVASLWQARPTPSMEMSLGLVGIADMLPALSKAQASILIPARRTQKEKSSHNNYPVKLWAIIRGASHQVRHPK